MKTKLPKSKNRIILVAGSLLLASGLGFGIWYYSKRKKDEKGFVSNDSIGDPNVPPGFKCSSKNYPLDYGTCHKDVKILQRYLKTMGANLGSYGKYKNGIDGRFGKLTKKATQQKLRKTSFSKLDIKQIEMKLNPKYLHR